MKEERHFEKNKYALFDRSVATKRMTNYPEVVKNQKYKTSKSYFKITLNKGF